MFTDDGFEETLAELAEAVPKETVLVFLRSKNDPDPGIYRAVNSTGLFASTDRAVVDTPLSTESPTVTELFHDTLADVQSIDDLIAVVAALK